MDGALAGRRLGDEEAGIEPLRAARRREPVTQVRKLIDRKAQPNIRAQFAQRALAAMQRPAPTLQCSDGVARQRFAFGIAREQQSRFFETLAHGGDRVVQTARFDAELRTDDGVVAASAAMPVAIARIDDAAGENPGAAVQVAAFGAPQQQDFEAGRRVAHYHQSRRESSRTLHGCVVEGRDGSRE